MADFMFQDPTLQNDQLKTRTVSCRVSITGNATAASKSVNLSGLPGHVAILASGIAVTGIDASATGISAQDTADAVLGVLLYDIADYDTMSQLTSLTVEPIQVAGATGVLAVARKGTSGLTASGNIWFQVTLTGGGALTSTGNVCELGITAVYKVSLP